MKKINMMDKSINSKVVSKRIMQLIFILIGVLAIYTAYLGFAYGAVNWYYGFSPEQGYSEGLLMLDSNVRFYSGLWLGVGIIMLWMIPRVDKDKNMLRVITIFFFLGGIGRLISISDGTNTVM
ncbi:DUF4345 domain-containing protein [Clostridium oryzae]|uniref:Uncharacterized protein n=1 Tax=Clostridium oryzae TaxID=1450648 RepID=A0A1V4IZA6_9CLOT|nr:DUF4345 domain-containing protein [Clostridium oryzae]OPJ65229.1 hypothetical protein CLORY_02290 [Clostridium oryzae]